MIVVFLVNGVEGERGESRQLRVGSESEQTARRYGLQARSHPPDDFTLLLDNVEVLRLGFSAIPEEQIRRARLDPYHRLPDLKLMRFDRSFQQLR